MNPVMTQERLQPRTLRDALGRFVTGVTIVTTLDPEGAPVGLTANSFTSVSLDPPLILWSLSKRSGNLAAFSTSGRFAVNILSQDQNELSARFASPTEDRFAGTGWLRGLGGLPLLPGCLAHLECATVHQQEAGDHVIFIGQVESFAHRDGPPLAFFSSRYATLADQASLRSAA
jgi:3-hydroxy-9,10-secoandrosta-1,3,5(10)-triene-9,17-dione monooxygenase reductase component